MGNAPLLGSKKGAQRSRKPVWAASLKARPGQCSAFSGLLYCFRADFRSRCWWPVPLLLFAPLVLFLASSGHDGQEVTRKNGLPGPRIARACIEFVVTFRGTIDGAPTGRQACLEPVAKNLGGYCVCQGSVAIPAPIGRPKDATCASLCRDGNVNEAVAIPNYDKCPADIEPFFPVGPAYVPNRPSRYDYDRSARRQLAASDSSSSDPAEPLEDILEGSEGPLRGLEEAEPEWWQRAIATVNERERLVMPPGPRKDREDDYVAKGLRLEPEHIDIARETWATFLEAAGPYPAQEFQGRGIAMLGGRMPYLVPSLIALKAIRKLGCSLPVEMWFPADEGINGALADKLRRLNVTIRKLVIPPQLPKTGFYLKAIVLARSAFKEVLLLDADQVPIIDVTQLFEEPEYTRTGALLWQDFWDQTWAPDAPAVLGVPRGRMPSVSHEAGQMLFDKERTWPAIVSALHFNLQHQLYHPLFVCYMGLGDKETFAMALIAHGIPYALVPTPTASLGFTTQSCTPRRCKEHFNTNSMLQSNMRGRPAFVHTNMPPKWNLDVPTYFSDTYRRWEEITPAENSTKGPWPPYVIQLIGFDLEEWVHRQLVALRCDEDMAIEVKYGQGRSKNALSGKYRLPFRPVGIELLEVYQGTVLTGPFLKTHRPTLWQRGQHLWNSFKFGRKKWWHDAVTHRKHSRVATREELRLEAIGERMRQVTKSAYRRQREVAPEGGEARMAQQWLEARQNAASTP